MYQIRFKYYKFVIFQKLFNNFQNHFYKIPLPTSSVVPTELSLALQSYAMGKSIKAFRERFVLSNSLSERIKRCNKKKSQKIVSTSEEEN